MVLTVRQSREIFCGISHTDGTAMPNVSGAVPDGSSRKTMSDDEYLEYYGYTFNDYDNARPLWKLTHFFPFPKSSPPCYYYLCKRR